MFTPGRNTGIARPLTELIYADTGAVGAPHYAEPTGRYPPVYSLRSLFSPWHSCKFCACSYLDFYYGVQLIFFPSRISVSYCYQPSSGPYLIILTPSGPTRVFYVAPGSISRGTWGLAIGMLHDMIEL